MSKSKRGRALSLLRSSLVFLTILVSPSVLVHAQQDWAERDKWQRPTEVLDALGVKPRSVVADVGAGEGYFTFHLAERVALKPGGLLAIIDAEDRLGESRKTYQSRHTLPEQFVRADAAQNGYRFLRELPGFSNPNRKKKYYFLLFEKPGGSPPRLWANSPFPKQLLRPILNLVGDSRTECTEMQQLHEN